MSDLRRMALIGATGLVGRAMMREAVGRSELRLTALARRECRLPVGARMELCIAPSEQWAEMITRLRPHVLICALGTTMKKVDGDEDAFRAVDQRLVMACAGAAHAAGVSHMVHISAVGARLGHKNLYLRVKGQVENDLARMNFPRLDILRPSLLLGRREGDRRPLEGMGQLLAPLAPLFLHGQYRRYRPISADIVARAGLNAAMKSQRGRYSYDYDEIVRCAERS